MKPDNPKPGTVEARSAGCTCPVIDNHYGRGWGGDGERYGWIMQADCPLHGRPGHYGPDGYWVEDGVKERGGTP